MTTAVTIANRGRPRRRQRWLELDDWRITPGGNFRLELTGYKVVIFMIYRGRVGAHWQARVKHREIGEKLFSQHHKTIDEAQLAALDLIREMYEEGYTP